MTDAGKRDREKQQRINELLTNSVAKVRATICQSAQRREIATSTNCAQETPPRPDRDA